MSTYVVVEGQGEQGAVVNLLTRLRANGGCRARPWAAPIRGRNLLTADGIRKFAELVRHRRDADGLLILADDDDGCPKVDGPRLAAAARAIALPFPTAIVLAYREYESLFLPCIGTMAGKPLTGGGGHARPGLLATARWEGDFEAKRNVKGWLTSQMPPGRSYKPTIDQLPLTQLVDFSMVRAAGLPWFGSLENALRFLETGAAGEAYPPEAKG